MPQLKRTGRRYNAALGGVAQLLERRLITEVGVEPPALLGRSTLRVDSLYQVGVRHRLSTLRVEPPAATGRCASERTKVTEPVALSSTSANVRSPCGALYDSQGGFDYSRRARRSEVEPSPDPKSAPAVIRICENFGPERSSADANDEERDATYCSERADRQRME